MSEPIHLGTGGQLRKVLKSATETMVRSGLRWPEVCAEMEKLFITAALRETEGSVYKAAEKIGMHRNTLSKKIREYEIDRQAIREESRQESS